MASPGVAARSASEPSRVRVVVLGSTGSIGTQTLEVVEAEPHRFEVVALSAGSSVDLLVEQAARHRPGVVAIADAGAAEGIADRLPPGTELLVGADSLSELPVLGDVVVNGIVGFAGLRATIATLRAGRRLALANKESLIAGGPVVRAALASPGAELVPVDSEHAALHQCLRANTNAERVARLVLTASGGPFRGRPAGELSAVTIDDALAHPTWSMGPKITVDSSTLMNKGLEVIEAHLLFDVPFDDIDVVVHPQSIVHSMVEFTDGSTIAQLSLPDMRLPIGYALAYPDRVQTPFGRIDWSTLTRLDFELPDREAFPCLDLAYAAGRTGGTAPAWLNAANEVAVAAFLDGRIRWHQIPDVANAVLQGHDGASPDAVDDVIRADAAARDLARTHIETIT
jgi:1-deoxy-D-xylulose-5-phosphate reductoisomerase